MQNKMALIKLALVFLLPVILAKLALELNWFNESSTNQGQLLNPVLDLTAIVSNQPPKWRILYVLPEQCDKKCEHALFSIVQVWKALGREQERVQSTVVFNERSDSHTLGKLDEQTHVQLLKQTHASSKNESEDDALSEGIFIVDTLGNGVLMYSLMDDKQSAILNSKAILADMRKLLKLSRIG